MHGRQKLTTKLLVPLPLLYLADLPEGAAVANVSQSSFPIVGSLVPADRLADIDSVFPRRREKPMVQVTPSRSVGFQHAADSGIAF